MSLSIGLSIGIDRAFSGAAGGGLSAPTLNYPSPLAANPTTIVVHVPVDWQSGDTLNLARSASVNMTSSTVLTHAITDADITAGTFSIGLSGVTLAGITYFDAYGTHGGVQSPNVSNIVTWGDTVAPTITTAATASVYETAKLAITLAATDTGGVPALLSDGTSPGWYISGGADQAQFQIAIVAGVPTLQWALNGSQSYGTPLNSTHNAANPYVVQITAVDYGGNKSAALTESVTVNAIVQTPTNAQPWFTNVTNAPLSTLEQSNTITLTGVTPGFNIPIQVNGTGFQYSINGGAWKNATGATDYFQNGQTLQLQDLASSSSYSTQQTCTVTVGNPTNTTQTWQVTTMANPANVAFTPSTTQPATTLAVGAASKSYTLDFQAGIAVVYAFNDTSVATLGSVTLDGTAMTSVLSPDTKTAVFTLAGVAAGNHTVVVNGVGGNLGNLNVASGTISNTAAGAATPSATQSLAWGFHSTTPATASALTVSANGIAVIFETLDSGTLPLVSQNAGQAGVANNGDTTTHNVRIATANATLTPGVTVTNAGYSSLLALAFPKV